MDKRLLFDENIIAYDKWRPKYCPDLFADIIEYSKIDSSKVAVEVGCGTGQATEPILKTGCTCIAIEYGKNFSDYVRDKFYEYSNFQVINVEYEKCQLKENSVDLLFSATAFHWIPEEEGYTKAYKMLKNGATLALFWNKPYVNKKDDPLHQSIQSVYDRFRPQDIGKPKCDIENDRERYQSISGAISKYGFKNFVYKLYKQTRNFTACDYISLLNTYSDHCQMPSFEKKEFEQAIQLAIEEHGGTITIYDTMDLYLAQKP